MLRPTYALQSFFLTFATTVSFKAERCYDFAFSACLGNSTMIQSSAASRHTLARRLLDLACHPNRLAATVIAVAQEFCEFLPSRARRERMASLRTFIGALPASFPSENRDLVIGFATGYAPNSVRPFVESLLSAGAFRGKVVLFVKREDRELITYLRSRGVIVVFFDAQAYPTKKLMWDRYFAYFDYLQGLLNRKEYYRYILLSDVRDVIFQKPLFTLPCSELECHYEGPRIGECSVNSFWIRTFFGNEALARLSEKRISCSGTVNGQMRGILCYLAQMQMLMLALPTKRRIIRGGDQGIHNYLLHSGYLPKARVLGNFERVATLHHITSGELHPDKNALVVNPDGTVSEIAHQWDRHPHLAYGISTAFGSTTNNAD